MRIAIFGVLAACGTSTGPGIDASIDVATEASDAAAEAIAPCKTGLPDAGTSEVVCDGAACGSPNICCVGPPENCVTPSSCGNLDLVWACDRSAHCGSGKTCCYGFSGDISSCPGAVESTGPTCESAPNVGCTVVCQTDLDCDAGKTCYAVVALAVGRTLGLCR